jgi:hypothetical protein
VAKGERRKRERRREGAPKEKSRTDSVRRNCSGSDSLRTQARKHARTLDKHTK